MPKKGKISGKDKSECQSHEDGPIVTNPDNTILMKILAKPGAKINAITGFDQNEIGVQIAAPPVDGEANTELVKYMAKLLGIRKSDISLDKGSRSRNKILVISGVQKDDVMAKIISNIEK